MPSWNIHIAQVEHLLEAHGAEALGIRDANAFLVGNFIPDVYVGFMVPSATRRIDYKLTHLAKREQIPVPDYETFWDFYIAERRERVTDLTRGAWAHLVADHVYNERVREILGERGLSADDAMRIAKQADFAAFGDTLPLALIPKADGTLLEQCARFAPYSISESDARATVEVAADIVEGNHTGKQETHPEFQLLDASFFQQAFAETERVICAGLERLASGDDTAYRERS